MYVSLAAYVLSLQQCKCRLGLFPANLSIFALWPSGERSPETFGPGSPSDPKIFIRHNVFREKTFIVGGGKCYPFSGEASVLRSGQLQFSRSSLQFVFIAFCSFLTRIHYLVLKLHILSRWCKSICSWLKIWWSWQTDETGKMITSGPDEKPKERLIPAFSRFFVFCWTFLFFSVLTCSEWALVEHNVEQIGIRSLTSFGGGLADEFWPTQKQNPRWNAVAYGTTNGPQVLTDLIFNCCQNQSIFQNRIKTKVPSSDITIPDHGMRERTLNLSPGLKGPRTSVPIWHQLIRVNAAKQSDNSLSDVSDNPCIKPGFVGQTWH